MNLSGFLFSLPVRFSSRYPGSLFSGDPSNSRALLYRVIQVAIQEIEESF